MASNNSLTLALAALLVAGLTACSKDSKTFEQDPLAGQPDAVRNGVPPELNKEPPQPKPLAADALRIDANDFYSFKEGVEGEAVLSGRILSPVNGREGVVNEDFEIVVENISDFPGATFEAATGKFRWTPPRQYVGAEFQRNARLQLMLVTKGTGTILATKKTVNVFVTRSEADPEVLSVEDLTTVATREGERRKFSVTIKDPDGLDLDSGRPRLLVVSNRQSNLNAAHMVYLVDSSGEANPAQDPLDKSKWVFKLWLDTREKELTKSQETFGFAVSVVSRFGRASAPRSVDALILTSLRDPLLSVNDQNPIRVVAGQENLVSFSVYDPQGESKLAIFFARCDLLPGAPFCSCAAQGSEANHVCTISWKVPASTPAGDLNIFGEIQSRSRVAGDPAQRKTTFALKVKVVPGPTSVPTPPAPAPSPSPAPPVPAIPAVAEVSNSGVVQ